MVTTRWFLNREGKWIVEGVRGNIAQFSKKPTKKQIYNLFKHRKRGTVYYELWKHNGKRKYFFDTRLRVSRLRDEYILVDTNTINIKEISGGKFK